MVQVVGSSTIMFGDYESGGTITVTCRDLQGAGT